jgi:hypothetical protein
MGMFGVDFSSPVKKKVKHKSSNGDDLSEGKNETEKTSPFPLILMSKLYCLSCEY